MLSFIKEKQAVQVGYIDRLKAPKKNTERRPSNSNSTNYKGKQDPTHQENNAVTTSLKTGNRNNTARTKTNCRTPKASTGSHDQKATSLHLNKIWSAEKPWKRGTIDIQEANANFNLSTKASTLAVVPSKHLTFLSFQMIYKIARKEAFQIKLPLGFPIAPSTPQNELKGTQQHPNHPRTDLHSSWATWKLRKRWSAVLRQRLSKVKILPQS